MNKQYYQIMFGAKKGYVYEYSGIVPEDTDTTAHITEELIAAMGIDNVSIVVVDYKGKNIVYTSNVDMLVHEEFKVLADLTPDPVVELPPVVADPAPEENP